MKILVTGAKGFVGKNLVAQLKNIRDGKATNYPVEIEKIFEYDKDSSLEDLERFCREADFVFNLAGVNRPENPEEFNEGNRDFASLLLDTLKKYDNKCPVMLSSSQQASLTGRFGNSEYGRSKLAGENLFIEYGKETGSRVLIYRFPNIFGKWCLPNYNSAVATFCHNIANGLSIKVNDPEVELELLYIDDLVDEMILALQGKEHRCDYEGLDVKPTDSGNYCYVPVSFKVKLGKIVELLREFEKLPETITVPEMPSDSFSKRLMATYLSYLPGEKAIFDLKMNKDNRGSFTELVKTLGSGQVSINISKPGITKGEHWHNTKWEQFIVVSGHGLIQMRKEVPSDSPLEERECTRKGSWRTANPYTYKLLHEKALNNKNNPTEAEKALWELVKANNSGAKFRRQHIIGDYMVDFVSLDKGLIIEVDGGYHFSPEQKLLDKQRTDFLQSKGFSVLRFSNNEVIGNPQNTLSIIKNALIHLPPLGGPEGVVNYFVSGNNIQSVLMLPGYTHNIINLSDTQDLVTVMYCNETFDPQKPDTYFDPVVK